jgi:gamma-glutamylputrescine oxidase
MGETDPAAYGNSWYSAAMAAPPERPHLIHDLDVDVCVIGAGLAGLTTARELARGGWSVAVLEAKRVAWNASGRNGGFVLPGFAEDIRRIVARVGLDHAKALWALADAGGDYVRKTIDETGMADVDPVSGWLDVSKVDNGDELLSVVSLLGQEFGAEIEGWPTERVRATLQTTHYFHAIHFPTAFHIHPLNYALGLARAAEQAGVRIFENTPALAIDPAGVRKRVATPSARIRAAHVVLAGNAHLGGLVPEIANTLLPVTTFMAVTAPLGTRLPQAIRFRGAVSDARSADHHYRIVDGDRLQWGGGAATWNGHPAHWARQFKRAITRIYPQLAPVEIEHAWSGMAGRTFHKMPQIGEVSPGLWLASGFAGQGLNTTAMAGTLIARAILDGDDTWRLFLPFDLVWTGGKLGRVAAQAIYWSTRVSAGVSAQLARRREEATRREEETAQIVGNQAPTDVMADTSAHAIKEVPGISADAVAELAAPLEADPPRIEPDPPPMPAAAERVAAADGATAPLAADVMAAAPGAPSRARRDDRASRGAGRSRRRRAVGETAPPEDDEPSSDGAA